MSRRKRRSPAASEAGSLPAQPYSPAPSRRTRYALMAAGILVALLAGAWWLLRPAAPPESVRVAHSGAANARFVGSESCAACHQKAYSDWKGSQHQRAMQAMTPDIVLGNFDQAKFRYAGVESTFFQRDGKYFVNTDGPDGKMADFEIKYTFGVEPLQQYLIPFPDGRLQALSIAWDSRPSEQGGQRWFHLYPKEKIDHRDELHWTRRSQNWNFMCADCHSTDVRKNYDATTNTFRTTWREISVSCESCHGPGSAHLDWARAKPADATKGLTVALNQRAGVHWQLDAKTGHPVRSRPRELDTEINVCAQCHARRSQIAEGYHAGLPFQDFYRPTVLSPGLYFADGQQRDEVFIWASFLQSRMYHAGVTCSDCHEPHGQKLRASGNAICATCHQAKKYDTPDHHHHAGRAEGTRCVDCHMPAKSYMVVDPRRDHSMRVPRPDLTVSLGTPNACTGCHQKNGAKWAAETVERWYGHRPQGYQRFAEALAYAERGLAEAGPSLAQLAQNPTQPAIAVATALEALVNYPIRPGVEAAQAGLANRDVLVRRASVSALAILPPARRLPLVAPLLDDSSRSVRIEAAYTLADTMASATAAQRAAFERAAAEYEAVQRYNADSPEARVALGNFYARQGRAADAQAQLQSALALEPAFVPAYVSLADLMRAQDRDAEAERILRDGLRQTPGAAALHHTLGLTLVRLQRTAEALDELRRATQRAPTEARFAYVYAVGLYSDGKAKAAIAEVDRALQQHPDNRDLLVAAANFRHESGDLPGARRYALRLYERYPNDLDAALLARQLGALR